MATLLKRLWFHMEMRRRMQCALLLGLMLVTSFAEILSIGMVLPFLGALTAPERIFELPSAQPVIQALKLTEPNQLLLPLTVAFGLASLTAGAMRLLLLWANTRLSFATGADLSIKIYRLTLYQPYTVHCERNSSEVINGISVKADGVIYGVIMPMLTLISSSIMLISILFALLIVQPVIALVTFCGFGFIYMSIIRLTRKQLLINGKYIARESTLVIKSLQEGLGGIRDVLIGGSQETYCQIYRNADSSLRRAQGNNLFIASSPRYGIEALGMVMIAVLAYSLTQQAEGIVLAIPILGTLVLGVQRLLPVLQQSYASWTQINSQKFSLEDTLDLLDQPLPNYATQQPKQLPFNHEIVLKNVRFRYREEAPYVLNQLNLTISKGSRVGFIGVSGSGKSSLLDIVMGLLRPTYGTLEVDAQIITAENHRAWQVHIAHVPQTIFLADSTIEENIAFGIPKDQIDRSLVKQAALQAQISETIESWPMQYQTFVGERGIRLSGGQRQRIGIARALYKQADVIIFDEATSALDSETEQAVMLAIEGLSKNLTILIIAHRLSTLKNCTKIVELSGGVIKREGSYSEIIKRII